MENVINNINSFFVYRFINVHKLDQHLEQEHKIELQTSVLQFDNFGAFLQWKEVEELHPKSWFVQKSGSQMHDNNKHFYYYCNRAGNYQTRGNNERSLKSQGSNKSVSHCSAYIQATVNILKGVVYVKYNCTHYNHELQLGHLPIVSSTRNTIANKLRHGVTPQRILDDIREVSATNISRDHLVNKKDVSVSTWVEEMEGLEYNPVLIFKQQGDQAAETCSNLEIIDFLLVIQTEFQRDMLYAHVKNGICIDATYKINDYDFNLITFMVLDDFQEGIPVAWAVSNREDKLVVINILQAIKEVCGSLKPSWFMSDMAPQYFSAWEEVFGQNTTKQLWCVWHVDRAWKDGIRRHVQNISQQKKIYHFLRLLLVQTNISTFRKLLAQTVTLCKEIAPMFAEYLNSRYCKNLEQWALCYRIGTPMNTNMHIESFHRVVENCIFTA